MLKTPRNVKTMVKKSVEIPIMMANVPAIEKCNLEKLKALPRFAGADEYLKIFCDASSFQANRMVVDSKLSFHIYGSYMTAGLALYLRPLILNSL